MISEDIEIKRLASLREAGLGIENIIEKYKNSDDEDDILKVDAALKTLIQLMELSEARGRLFHKCGEIEKKLAELELRHTEIENIEEKRNSLKARSTALEDELDKMAKEFDATINTALLIGKDI